MLHAMHQLVTRVDDSLALALDDLVREGAVASRSEAVRLALREFLDRRRRAEEGLRIVGSYADRPQSDDEVAWSDAATARMISEEPW